MFKKIRKLKYKKNLDVFNYNLFLWNFNFFLEETENKKNNIFYFLSLKDKIFILLKQTKKGKKKIKKYFFILIQYFLTKIFKKYTLFKLILSKKILFICFNFLNIQTFFNLSDNFFLSKTSISIGIALKMQRISLKNLRRKKKGEKIFNRFIYSFLSLKKFNSKNIYLIFKGKYLKTKVIVNYFLKKSKINKIYKIIHCINQSYGTHRFKKIRSIKKKLKKNLKKEYVIY